MGMEERLKAVEESMKHMKDSSQNLANSSSNKFRDTLNDFPLESMEELNEMEKRFLDKAHKNELVCICPLKKWKMLFE
jgi:flagellar basal body rod protein FlgF